MMHVSVLTLFPQVMSPYLEASILGRAQKAGLLHVTLINPRNFAEPPHYKVDDIPYGGGDGMVLMCAPWEAAFASLMPLSEKTQVLVTSPAGACFDQPMAREFARHCDHLVVLCGHYEGFDERLIPVLSAYGAPVKEVSVGDYVLTGGELPALVMIDAVARLMPGVVQKAGSVAADSFGVDGLLDYPAYTRPAVYKGHAVPEVLTSGNHAAIAHWRQEQRALRTRQFRPDLLADLN
ncbi:MAG: tRNA (guanosine(37)-N1)-methyltransferase TrmD [Vampirovibrionales bacterium]|nr:tRNA (guanosine(37)-N1)-methyltransferase TrmD [Vampirovibrionales bacterium]